MSDPGFVPCGTPGTTYRRVGFYRGVRYEWDSFFPPGEGGRFVGGGPPGFLRAREIAAASVAEGRIWAGWFVECAACAHAEKVHLPGVRPTRNVGEAWDDRFDDDDREPICGEFMDSYDDGDVWYDIYCGCPEFVRRAPLAVLSESSSQASSVG